MVTQINDITPTLDDNTSAILANLSGRRFNEVNNSPEPNVLIVDRNNQHEFAFETISVRIPKIIMGVIEENQGILPTPTIKDLQNLAKEIESGDIIMTLPEDIPAHIWEMWRDLQVLITENQLTWHDALPLYPIEKYVYTLLNSIVGHHETRLDIFRVRKEKEFSKEEFWNNLQFFIYELNNEKKKEDKLAKALEIALYGNTGDLAHISGDMGNIWNPQKSIVVNHSHTIARALLEKHIKEVTIVSDNAVKEFSTNLCLAKALLETGNDDLIITFHVKAMPLLVSDTTSDDVNIFINKLHAKAFESKQNELAELFFFLQENIRNHRIIIRSDNYWNSGNRSDQISPHIKEHLSAADFVFFMGDMNSRWMTEANGEQALEEIRIHLGFIKNLIRIATCKSQNANFGVPYELSQQLEKESPGFARQGKHGVIMYFEKGVLLRGEHILTLGEQ